MNLLENFEGLELSLSKEKLAHDLEGRVKAGTFAPGRVVKPGRSQLDLEVPGRAPVALHPPLPCIQLVWAATASAD